MKKSKRHKLLLIGIGNSGRSDDALGWEFAERVQENPAFEGEVVFRYQLQIEDADLIKDYEEVYFIDAYHGQLSGGYAVKKCEPNGNFTFTTHELSPETILFLCEELYDTKPKANLVLIQGEEWGLKIGMSGTAENNLLEALSGFLVAT